MGNAAADTVADTALRRSSPEEPGIRRVRRGGGFGYLDASGHPITNRTVLRRIKALVIPPAWTDVWICADPNGHVQAVGRDDAGRLQYRYHDEWRALRDLEKHRRVLTFGRRLPRLRERIDDDLALPGLGRERVVAGAVRLLELGLLRVGGEEYADDEGGYGLSTLQRDHARVRRGVVELRYSGKGGSELVHRVFDPRVARLVASLRRRRDHSDRLFGCRDGRGSWSEMRSDDVNDYIRVGVGMDATAKDFRTWHATVLMAIALAVSEPAAGDEASRRRAVARAYGEVATYLGNTPAVCRASYVDPLVVERYEEGRTIRRCLHQLGDEWSTGDLATTGPAERALLRLLR